MKSIETGVSGHNRKQAEFIVDAAVHLFSLAHEPVFQDQFRSHIVPYLYLGEKFKSFVEEYLPQSYLKKAEEHNHAVKSF